MKIVIELNGNKNTKKEYYLDALDYIKQCFIEQGFYSYDDLIFTCKFKVRIKEK